MAKNHHTYRTSGTDRPTVLAEAMATIRGAIHWLDSGLWRRRDLSARLKIPLDIIFGLRRPSTSTAYIGWGLKASGKRARALAAKHERACWLLEDGFLRSVEGGDTPSWSLVVDDVGIYYDAAKPSRLEHLISLPLSDAEQIRTAAIISLWQKEKLSKYNSGRDPDIEVMPANYVLVVDQTAGDVAIAAGNAGPDSFEKMLSDALHFRDDCMVVVKLHPEVVHGRKQGHFNLSGLRKNPRIKLLADDSHPALWIANATAVFVVTSQLGFEALLWAKPVHVYGVPFYAGWGLTDDKLPTPARRHTVSVAQLAHAALVKYPRYFNPETGEPCEIEALMEWLSLQRRQRHRFNPNIIAYGFSNWKRPFVREFLAGSNITFSNKTLPALNECSSLATWGHKHTNDLAVSGQNETILRIEDGFLRSVGLGADLVRPLSWVIDPIGIYYDARYPSLLETYLATWPFDDSLRERAKVLRERIVASGVTKYNLRSPKRWSRPPCKQHVVLVIGQVETDASIRYGANTIRRNIDLLKAVRRARPEAWLVYKPHPDVTAGLRHTGKDENVAHHWCDEIVSDIPYDAMLETVDEVHVLTSLAGFEALMRNVPVTTWGQPFYAGWGLTHDLGLTADVSRRRQRRLTLDELVAGTLILYPTYVSRASRHFCTPERALQDLQEWRNEYRPPSRLRHIIARIFRKP